MNIQITPTIFKHGKERAYTVTYDEALTKLFDHVVPLQEEAANFPNPKHVDELRRQ